MTSKALLTGFLRKGKQILQNVVKTKTQKVQVKVTQATKQQQTAVRYNQQQATDRLQTVWSKIVPKVYYQSLASQLGRQAAWRGGRNVPLLAFMGLVVAQNSNKEEDEIINRIQEFVKTTSEVPGCSLLQRIQSLSLDQFEIGRQIGQGCNAAVYEARFTQQTNVKEDEEVQSNSANKVDVGETESDTSDDISEAGSEILDNISEAGSDISFVRLSDEEIDESEMAPTEFHIDENDVFYTYDNVSEAGSDISILSLPDEVDENSVLSQEQGLQERCLPLSMMFSEILMLADRFDILKDPEDTWDNVQQDDLEYASMDSGTSHEGGGKISGRSKFDLALKMMFNYGIESRADNIMREMEKEAVPARLAQSQEQMEVWENGNKVRKKSLPPHPNIVEMWGVFVDPVPQLPDCLVNYPAALPARINPKGAGRNMTLFLIMKKYSTTLSDYLTIVHLSFRERLVLLTQLLEAVDHMGRNGVAHRDMKSDNVLLDTSIGGYPQLVLSDFGCCLADPIHGLHLPYPTDEIDRGGNTALMAPEIACAHPGRSAVLDYHKADLWGAGALAYEILGADNPFYTNSSKGRLDSRTYQESELPPLPETVPVIVARLVTSLLCRDQKQRPTARLAADVLHILLWAPQQWLTPGNTVQRSEVKWWLITMATEILLEKGITKRNSTEATLKRVFLENFNVNNLKVSLNYLGVDVA